MKDLRRLSRGKITSDSPAEIAHWVLEYWKDGCAPKAKRERGDFVDFAEKLFRLEDPRADKSC